MPSLFFPTLILTAVILMPTNATAADRTRCEELGDGHHLEQGYYPEGGPQIEKCMKGEVADGPYRAWHPNGTVKAVGQYRDGEMTGRWTRWFENGKKRDEGEWVDGVPDGAWRIYRQDGTLKAKKVFQDGEALGETLGVRRPLSLTVIGAVSAVSYREEIERYSSFGFSPRLMARYAPIKSRWEFSGTASITAFSLGASQQGVGVHFVTTNARAAYRIPLSVDQSWSLGFSAGLAYARMLVDENKFGFGNLLYPEFYPSLSRVLPKTGVLSFYVKYVPLGDEFFSLTHPDEAEIGFGGSWTHPFGSRRPWVLSLDVAKTSFKVSSSHELSLRSVKLGFGYLW